MEKNEKKLTGKEYEKLSKELLTPLDTNNAYQTFLKAREEALPLSKAERKQIEDIIKLKTLKIFKKAQNALKENDDNEQYFKYERFFDIAELTKYFNVITAIGDRNIGKTTSSNRVARDTVAKGKRFVKFRNIQDEIEEQALSDDETLFIPNGWKNGGSKKKPIIKNKEEEIVGWYRDINTSGKFKSIEFPNTELIIWEEFNSEVYVANKFNRFVTFVSTAQRHRPNMKIIVQANYVSQNDPWLVMQGVGLKGLSEQDFVHFNWTMGTIVIFVPQGIYKSTGDKDGNTGYKLALGSFDLYQNQYGSNFNDEEPINIINDSNFIGKTIKAKFNIYYKMNMTSTNMKYGAFKMTMYSVYDTEGKRHNVLMQTKGSNNAPIFTFDHENIIMYPQALLISVEGLGNLIDKWKLKQFETTTIEEHVMITAMLAAGQKAIFKEDTIEEIQNMLE